MNSINRVIVNPLFLLAFFGTGLLCLALLVGRINSPLVVAGSLLYLIGTIGVTMICNVPLNDKLAAVSPSANDMETQWHALSRALDSLESCSDRRLRACQRRVHHRNRALITDLACDRWR